MGTRNTTMVIDKQGEIKVAQYGQWDGYPSGQGATILKFLKAKTRRTKLENKLKRVVLVDEKDEFIVNYNHRIDTNSRTPEDEKWFNSFITRDIGGEILENIANSKEKAINLIDRGDKETDQWVQWVYKVDFKENKLFVHFSAFAPPIKAYDLDKLPTQKVFIDELDKIAYADEE